MKPVAFFDYTELATPEPHMQSKRKTEDGRRKER